MSTKSKKFFLVDELVTRANEALPSELALTERTVRYYQSNNLIGKGLKISELPEEFSSKIVQRGNQRYFTPADFRQTAAGCWPCCLRLIDGICHVQVFCCSTLGRCPGVLRFERIADSFQARYRRPLRRPAVPAGAGR